MSNLYWQIKVVLCESTSTSACRRWPIFTFFRAEYYHEVQFGNQIEYIEKWFWYKFCARIQIKPN